MNVPRLDDFFLMFSDGYARLRRCGADKNSGLDHDIDVVVLCIKRWLCLD